MFASILKPTPVFSIMILGIPLVIASPALSDPLASASNSQIVVGSSTAVP